jgi:putative PEP-CTERM system histidine kinase
MAPTLILWGHALAALLFAALALWALRSAGDGTLPRKPLAAALGMTALWALAVAGIGEEDLATQIALGARNLAWLAFMIIVQRRRGIERPPAAIGTVYGVVAVVILIKLALHATVVATPEIAASALAAAQLLGMMVAVAALVLVQALYNSVNPERGSGLRPVVLAMGAMWLVDVNLLSVAYLTSTWPAALAALRGLAMALIAITVAAGLQRRGDWPMQISRTVAYQSLSLVAIGLYFALLALATTAIAAIGGANARLLQTAFVFGSTAAILTLVSSTWLRAWIKVKLAKHFFRHRYDYRAEWMRFTETLGEPEDNAPLDERIVKALADLTDSPAGVLLVPDGEALTIGATWNVDRALLPAGLGADWAQARIDATLVLEMDAAGRRVVPASVRHWTSAWAAVPLPHHKKLAGMILLARPPVPRALDWEDFDLLKAAGRQLASYLAEERAQAALAEAQRFDEFNRRFAFIMHDIKNLVSQLTLVARNAERHADNPAFRADMVATLHDSAGRMNDMLARLSQHHAARGDAPVATPLVPLVRRMAKARRAQHRVDVRASGDPLAIVEPALLETLLGHLIQNAIEASDSNAPVEIEVGTIEGEARIEVIDQGCGMSPAFVREKLFKPFVSSKPGGFGLGAFEAQKLAAEMGGRIEVDSAEGRGTRFAVVLRAAGTTSHQLGQAA